MQTMFADAPDLSETELSLIAFLDLDTLKPQLWEAAAHYRELYGGKNYSRSFDPRTTFHIPDMYALMALGRLGDKQAIETLLSSVTDSIKRLDDMGGPDVYLYTIFETLTFMPCQELVDFFAAQLDKKIQIRNEYNLYFPSAYFVTYSYLAVLIEDFPNSRKFITAAEFSKEHDKQIDAYIEHCKEFLKTERGKYKIVTDRLQLRRGY
ncbi:hypothetical protein [Eisenibacter elegans]|uniref:hypothetical protein n=1 Tax=Eisenibacter elegans TaxID=997 RepID=UPI0012B54C40|nr:hypothetical protein [Eisenibacter elegans]